MKIRKDTEGCLSKILCGRSYCCCKTDFNLITIHIDEQLSSLYYRMTVLWGGLQQQYHKSILVSGFWWNALMSGRSLTGSCNGEDKMDGFSDFVWKAMWLRLIAPGLHEREKQTRTRPYFWCLVLQCNKKKMALGRIVVAFFRQLHIACCCASFCLPRQSSLVLDSTVTVHFAPYMEASFVR